MKKYLRQFVIVLLIIPCVVVLLAACGSGKFKYTREYINANLPTDFSITYGTAAFWTDGRSRTSCHTIARKGGNYYMKIENIGNSWDSAGIEETLYIDIDGTYRGFQSKNGGDWVYSPQRYFIERSQRLLYVVAGAVIDGAKLKKIKDLKTTEHWRNEKEGWTAVIDKEMGIMLRISYDDPIWDINGTTNWERVSEWTYVLYSFKSGDAVSIPTIDL